MIRAEYQDVYNITVTLPDQGTITANTETEKVGNEVELTVTPDAGYRLVEGSLLYNLFVLIDPEL